MQPEARELHSMRVRSWRRCLASAGGRWAQPGSIQHVPGRWLPAGRLACLPTSWPRARLHHPPTTRLTPRRPPSVPAAC